MDFSEICIFLYQFLSENFHSENFYRRSLYFVKSLKKGDVIKIDDIRSVRPGFGLPTKMFDSVVGSQVNCNVSYGDPVKLADIIMKSDTD